MNYPASVLEHFPAVDDAGMVVVKTICIRDTESGARRTGNDSTETIWNTMKSANVTADNKIRTTDNAKAGIFKCSI